jgi:hypothetical protein
MSIQEIFSNFKRLGQGSDTGILLLIVFVGVASFWLGRLSIEPEVGKGAPHIQMTDGIQARELPATVGAAPLVASGTTSIGTETMRSVTERGYVASKNGTKYHLPWCSGAQRIKDENKVWFKTKEDAEKAGFMPASNCKGI